MLPVANSTMVGIALIMNKDSLKERRMMDTIVGRRIGRERKMHTIL